MTSTDATSITMSRARIARTALIVFVTTLLLSLLLAAFSQFQAAIVFAVIGNSIALWMGAATWSFARGKTAALGAAAILGIGALSLWLYVRSLPPSSSEPTREPNDSPGSTQVEPATPAPE